MKKRIAALLCLMLLLPLVSCGRGAEDVAGKTFVYEKEGFYGKFTITLRTDGTFTYYEGYASSYIGMGEWTVDGDLLILSEGMPTLTGSRTVTNRFEIGNGKLIWRAEGSDNFSRVKVKDGEAFNETPGEK